jgi:hypothetical protein
MKHLIDGTIGCLPITMDRFVVGFNRGYEFPSRRRQSITLADAPIDWYQIALADAT